MAVVQNPTLSLEGDVASTYQVIDRLPGPVTLVGHSYGGVVITEAGSHPEVNALVYIAAFAPDQGESVASQVSWGVDALAGTVSRPAWRTERAWYPVATDDRMIPPPPSTPCPSGSAPGPSRSPPATASTSRSPTPSPT
ncbi:alpha/beta fold hydrolase [Streptomyces virginiae]